jgi:hypothetical protein
VVSRLKQFGLLTVLALACDTEGNVDPPFKDYFVKYYGTQGDQEGIDMVLNADGTIVILGTSRLNANSDLQVYVVKVDGEGSVVWQQTFGGQGDDVAKDLELTQSGDLVFLADSETAAGDYDVFLAIVDQSGTQLDSVVHGFPGTDEVSSSVTPLSNGDFMVSGYSTNTALVSDPVPPASDITDATHFRFLPDLTPITNDAIWRTGHGNGINDYGVKTIANPNDSLYFFGQTDALEASPSQLATFAAYELSPTGASAIPNFYGDTNNDEMLSSVIRSAPSSGGGYLMVGTRVSGSGARSILLAKVREVFSPSLDDKLWDQTLSFPPAEAVGVAAESSQSSGYLVVGTEISGPTDSDILLIRISSEGAPLWSAHKSFGGEQQLDRAGGVKELPDGKILVVGTVTLESQTKVALFKLNANGEFAP